MTIANGLGSAAWTVTHRPDAIAKTMAKFNSRCMRHFRRVAGVIVRSQRLFLRPQAKCQVDVFLAESVHRSGNSRSIPCSGALHSVARYLIVAPSAGMDLNRKSNPDLQFTGQPGR